MEASRVPRRGAAGEEPSLSRAAQSFIEEILPRRDGEPGLAVSVTVGSDVVARHCVGLANLPHGVPIGPHTRFHIVSVSKTFLAASVLVLAARGALRLDDPVRRHVPEMATDSGATIRHLLSMTSGLRDVLEIERLRGVWGTAESRPRELLELAVRQSAVSAPAGAQYMYANVNAVLLEEVIARVSGMSAEAFRRAVIYDPLGLRATGARPHESLVVPDLAEPYVPDAIGNWVRPRHLLGIAADPLVTSLDDLTRWLLALRSGTVGGVDVRSAMAAPTQLRDGRPLYYGLGLAVRRYRGLTVLCHTGSQPGYKAHVAYVPERDLGLVILSNREDTRAPALAARIMDHVVGTDFPRPHPTADAALRLEQAGVTRTQLSAIEGSYVDAETGEWVTLEFEDGVLRGETLGDPFFLYHDRHGVFRDGDDYRATIPVELRLDCGHADVVGPLDRGHADFVGRLDLGGQAMTLRKSTPPVHTPETLAGFVGTYENRESQSLHKTRIDGRRLVIDYGLAEDGGSGFVMDPIAEDIFLVRPTAPGIAYRHLFRFERDVAGQVVGALVTMERLKHMQLLRVATGEHGQ